MVDMNFVTVCIVNHSVEENIELHSNLPQSIKLFSSAIVPHIPLFLTIENSS